MLIVYFGPAIMQLCATELQEISQGRSAQDLPM